MPPASPVDRADDEGCGLCRDPDAQGHPHRAEVLGRQCTVESQLKCKKAEKANAARSKK